MIVGGVGQLLQPRLPPLLQSSGHKWHVLVIAYGAMV